MNGYPSRQGENIDAVKRAGTQLIELDEMVDLF